MISNDFIRQATEEYHEESMTAIPTENEIDHVFSDRFEENMKSVIKKNNHPQLKRVLRMAASFALVILIAGGSVMALSPTARAAVMGWLFSQEGTVFSYTSMGTKTESEVFYKYDLAVIPEGYVLWQEIVDETQSIMLYAEEETGLLLKLTATPNDGTGAMFLITTTDQKETVQIGDITADLYPSESEDSAPGLAWVDPENDYLICLDGFFSQEELIDMAISLIKTEIPKS